MKSTGRKPRVAGRLPRLLLALGCLLLATACAVGAPPATQQPVPAQMSDPLFGIGYDTGKVSFERLPSGTAKAAELKPPQWIYARSGDITVVSGFLHIESDDPAQPGTSIEPDFGVVLRSEGKGVTILGVPDLLFGDPPLIDAAQREPLLADAVRRYIQAWGGKDKLQQALRDFDDPGVVPEPLRAALKAQGLQVGK